MKKNKIFKKFFLMTLFLVITIFFMQFVFQVFFFEKYYIFSNKKHVKEVVIELKDKIESGKLEEKNIQKELYDVSVTNDIFVGMISSNGVPKYGFTKFESLSYITVEDINGKVYKVDMDPYYNKDEVKKYLYEGSNIEVQGIYDSDGKKVYPSYIVAGGEKFDSIDKGDFVEIEVLNKASTIVIDEDNIQNSDIEIGPVKLLESINLNVQIKEVNMPNNEHYGLEYRRNRLIEEALLYLKSQNNLANKIENEDMIEYIKNDSYTGIKNMIFIQPVKISKNDSILMFAVGTLQPVEKTYDILSSYYLILMLAAIILSFVVSYFYSRKFTKPLIHLSEVTGKMSRLDFSQTCVVNTGDEIEELSISINSMSKQLKDTLEEIKESNEQLKEDLIYKEKMVDFRKRILADASHELKTPLTVMKGICEGIVDGVYDASDTENYKKILSNADYMSKLVHELLEISKIESGEVPMSKENFTYIEVIEKVEDKLKLLMEKKKQTIKIDIKNSLVIGDKEKITKVIINLWQNAIQYTKEEGHIDIYSNTIDDKEYLIIENTPSHIEKSQLNKVWEPYYRVDKSRNKNLGGSGLGLYLVKEVLEKLASDYGIENTKDGVKVFFSLEKVGS